MRFPCILPLPEKYVRFPLDFTFVMNHTLDSTEREYSRRYGAPCIAHQQVYQSTLFYFSHFFSIGDFYEQICKAVLY